MIRPKTTTRDEFHQFWWLLCSWRPLTRVENSALSARAGFVGLGQGLRLQGGWVGGAEWVDGWEEEVGQGQTGPTGGGTRCLVCHRDGFDLLGRVGVRGVDVPY